MGTVPQFSELRQLLPILPVTAAPKQLLWQIGQRV